jgi:ubiquitin carboxyl-terminal hydrolase 25/28
MRADGSTLREYLEDIVVELLALISKIASEYCLPNPAASEGWSSADRDVERTLAAQGCMFCTCRFGVRKAKNV